MKQIIKLVMKYFSISEEQFFAKRSITEVLRIKRILMAKFIEAGYEQAEIARAFKTDQPNILYNLTALDEDIKEENKRSLIYKLSKEMDQLVQGG